MADPLVKKYRLGFVYPMPCIPGLLLPLLVLVLVMLPCWCWAEEREGRGGRITGPERLVNGP